MEPLKKIMVPLSARRHRLYEPEIPEVIRGLLLRLEQLQKDKNDPETAKLIIDCANRLIYHKPGRPKNSEFSWELASYIISSEEQALAYLKEQKEKQPTKPA